MTLDIKHLRELLAKATPGEWYTIDTFGTALADIATSYEPDGGSPNILGSFLWGDEGPTAAQAMVDAALSVALRNAASELLDAAEENGRLRTALEKSNALLNQWIQPCFCRTPEAPCLMCLTRKALNPLSTLAQGGGQTCNPDGEIPSSPKSDPLAVADPGNGWRLLNEGEQLQEGDGFLDPHLKVWVDYVCRPDLFRGGGLKGSWYFVPKNDTAHTWPWRRRAAMQTSAPE